MVRRDRGRRARYEIIATILKEPIEFLPKKPDQTRKEYRNIEMYVHHPNRVLALICARGIYSFGGHAGRMVSDNLLFVEVGWIVTKEK